MNNATVNELERLAEADGATITRTTTGSWWAKDRDGITVVRGALSRVEACAQYCEDRDLCGSTPEAILARIKFAFRPYDTMDAFGEGFTAYQTNGCLRRQPYDATVPGETAKEACRRSVNGQAYDRGANAAMLYARALVFLDDNKDAVEKAGPGWLVQFLRSGRC